LTGREVQETEAYLHDRFDAQGAVCVQAAVPLTTTTWWSSALLQRLGDVNRELNLSLVRERPRP
jgi:hypothetical protein